MNHRERVMAALNHEVPDRTPIDLGGTRDSSIVVEGYERLKAYFGVEAENRITSSMMRVVDVDEQILQALDIDVRGIFPDRPGSVLDGQTSYTDQWGVERVRPEGAWYFDQISFPLAGEITPSDIINYPWPDPADPLRTAGLRERVRRIHEEAECAAVLNLPSGFVHTSQYLRGFEDWFMDFVRDPKTMQLLFDAVLDISMAVCDALLDEIGDEVDILMASDDLGTQAGLMVSPAAYRQYIKPRHEKYFRLMHEKSPGKVFFHTCGSVVDILDDLIEIGVDVLHPVQVTAAGMDPAYLKREYGDRLAFWGAIDTQHALPYGSVGDVRREVEERIEVLGRGGGYVLGAVHNIQPDVPVENILAMYEHAREYRPSSR
jgi:uroporphyrinogen decarboxylase